MLYGLYISAGGLRAIEAQQAVAANNLANVSTPGFKLDRVSLASRPAARAPGAAGRAAVRGLEHFGGVMIRGTVTDLTAGPLEETKQALDIALNTGAAADGFLGVRGTDGSTRWTRDGRLALDESGQLVTQAGRLTVLNEAGQPISLEPGDGPITIDVNGRICQGDSEMGQLKLATFGRPDLLVKQGGGLFAAGAGAELKPFAGQVKQGYVEASAVEPTTLLADLIQVQRAYEANANMIRMADQTLGRAVNDIAKI